MSSKDRSREELRRFLSQADPELLPDIASLLGGETLVLAIEIFEEAGLFPTHIGGCGMARRRFAQSMAPLLERLAADGNLSLLARETVRHSDVIQYLSPEVMNALIEALSGYSSHGYDRAEALTELAARLPVNERSNALIEEALSAARKLKTGHPAVCEIPHLLRGLTGPLPKETFEELVTLITDADQDDNAAKALIRIVLLAPDELKDQIAEDILENDSPESVPLEDRFALFVTMSLEFGEKYKERFMHKALGLVQKLDHWTPDLIRSLGELSLTMEDPEKSEHINRAIAAVGTLIQDEDRAQAWRALASLGDATLEERVRNEVHSQEWTGQALLLTAPYLSADQMTEAVEKLTDGWRPRLDDEINALAPYLSGRLLLRAIEIAEKIKHQTPASSVMILRAVGPYIYGSVIIEYSAVKAARSLDDPWYRGRALAAIFPFLSAAEQKLIRDQVDAVSGERFRRLLAERPELKRNNLIREMLYDMLGRIGGAKPPPETRPKGSGTPRKGSPKVEVRQRIKHRGGNAVACEIRDFVHTPTAEVKAVEVAGTILDAPIGDTEPPVSAQEPANHVNFTFDDVTRPVKWHRLNLNEGFLSGNMYRMTVGIGSVPDARFGGPERPPEIERPETEQETIDLHVALFIQGCGISIEGNRLDTIQWPAEGPSIKSAEFKLLATETAVSCMSQADVFIYHKTNLLYTASFTIMIQPKSYVWNQDDRPITWVFRADEDRFRSNLFLYFSDMKELSERALNIAIQAAKNKDEYMLTAFLGRAEFPARVVMKREEMTDCLIKMRARLDELRKSAVYLDGGFDQSHTYVGDYVGKEGGGYNRAGEQNKGKARVLFEGFMAEMARMGSMFYDGLFATEDGMKLRAIIGEYLREGDIIQIWIDNDATDFVFPWIWMYCETVDPGDRYKVTKDLFWGYRYIVELMPQFPETSGEYIPHLIQSDHLRMKIGIYMFEPTTRTQMKYFNERCEESHGSIECEVWDDDKRWESFLPQCDSQILYFFSHGHTAKPGTAADQKFYDMVAGWKAWMTQQPSEAESEVTRQHRLIAEEFLGEFEKDAGLLNETFIRLSKGYLLLREIANKADLRRSSPLVFLNMCESAQVFPSISNGLVDIFLKKGARGVLGTEIPMIDSFADVFSRSFFNSFFYRRDDENTSAAVGEILLDLRRKFLDMGNPLGFAYTFYGDATTRLSRSLPMRNDKSGFH